MRKDYAVEADSLKPYIVPWIAAAVAAGGAASGSAGAGGALTAHELNGPYHLGTLNRGQAPWVATDISVAIASHAALPDVHHARQHGIVSASDHTITGAALSLVGATATNALGLITPSNNPGVTESVLKATAGLLTLPTFTATTKVTSPLIDTASGNLTLQPTGNFVKLAAGRGIESAGTFVSGFTGAGLRIDDGITKSGKTSIEADNLTVRGTMRVYELVIQQIRMTNGSLLVSSTAKIKSVSGAGPYTMTTDGQHGLAVNDIILAQRWNPTQGALTGTYIYRSAMRVTSITTAGTDWQFGAVLLEGDPPIEGAEYGRIGNTTDTSRQGGIYLTSDDTYAPYIDIYNDVTSMALWTGAAKLKARLGRLDGISDAVLNPTGYGLYSANAYLKGVVSAANDVVRLDDTGARVKATTASAFAATNAYRFTNAGGTEMGGVYGRDHTSAHTVGLQALGDATHSAFAGVGATGANASGAATTYVEARNSGGSKVANITLDVTNSLSYILLGAADYTQFNMQTRSIGGHRPLINLGANLGEAAFRWDTLHVRQIIADSISGTTMNGAEWEYAGNMVIDANSASANTTVSIVNQAAGAWVANLAVEGSITSGGVAVSLVGHNHDDRYFTEVESDARYVQTATLSGYVLKTGDTMTGPLLLANGSSTVPALAFSSDTSNGIYRVGAGVLGIPRALQAGWVKNSMIGFGGQGANDLGMLGFYDRNELTNADLRGTVTVNITGAGAVTTSSINNMFNARGGYLIITGTDATTTQIQIQVDMGATVNNYGSTFWQPFLQYRIAWASGSGSKYRAIVVEVSTNGTTWVKPASGWESTDMSASEIVTGLWMGSNAQPGVTWRYARFTLTDRVAGTSNADQIWISQIGLRHYAAQYTRAWLHANGDTAYGALVVRTGNAAALDVQTAAGTSVFRVNTSSALVTVAGDLSALDLLAGDGSAALPAFAFTSDPDSGLYRSAANTWHLVAGGVAIQTISAAGISVTGTATATGGLIAPSLTTASGNLTIGSVGGTVAFGGQILSGTNWSVAATGAASFAPATDTTHDFGQARLGFVSGAAGEAFFAQRANASLTNFALRQNASGNTFVNSTSATGLWINGSEVLSINSARGLPAGSGLKDWGDYNRRWRTIHAEELAVQTLVAQNVIATIGGDIIVTPTTKLIGDIVSTAGGIGQSSLYTTLTAYWKLDEASGDRYDSKGSSTLTNTNTVGAIAGKVGNASTFVKASSQRLSAADNSALSVGDIDFYVSCWVYGTLDDGTSQYIATKSGSSGNRAWYLYFDWATNQIKFRVFDASDNSTTVTASTFGVVTTAVWYFVEAWHNAATNQIGVAVNGTSNTSTHTTGSRDETGPFQIGALNSASHFDGYIDEFGYWKNYIPNSTERTWLYNAGAGRTIENIYLYGVTDINLDVEHNNLRSGEWILLKTAPAGIQQTEKMIVTSSATPVTVGGKSGYRYTASRDQDGSGPNNWYIGDAVASQQKNVGEGHLWLTATTTVHGHTGPALIGYVRTGALVNDIKPVFAKGNLRSFVDYVTDEYGDAAGNDLTLLPNTGFQGYTIDRTNGMRLFNTDLRIYASGVEALRITPADGFRLAAGTAAQNQINVYDGAAKVFSQYTYFDNVNGWTETVVRTTGRSALDGSILKIEAELYGGTDNAGIWVQPGNISIFGATINLQDNVYASGNVGIGVAAGYKLDVGDRMRVRTGAAGSGGIWYADSAANNRSFAGLYTDGASPIWGVWNNGDWRFFIDSAGNTGIGVAPQRTLHVHSGTEAVLLLTNTASGAGFNDGLYVGIQNSGAYVWLYEALPLIFGTSGTERFRVTSGGDVGIGVTPSYKLDVNGAAHASSFPTSSDARLKTGLAPIQGALGRLSRITPYNFYWRQGYNGYDQFLDEDGQPRLQIGFVAQEVEAEFPEVISTWRHGGNIPLDDARAVDYARLVPVLWSAVQELHAEVLELRSQLN